MSHGELLLSTETSDLELINENGGREQFHSFSPFLTFGVCVHEDEIFVGVAKSSKKSNKYEGGRIVVLDMKGHVKCTFQKDAKSEKQLLTCPTRIVAYSDIICVIDILEIDENNPKHSCGRIVAINQKGEEKWSYSHKLGATYNLFSPQDITINSAGLILISDYWDYAIHAINIDGDVTGWIQVEEFGYYNRPMSLDVDDPGLLWVGCNSEEFKKHKQKNKNKIFSFKLS